VRVVTGRVAEFDDYRGLGTVVADDGRRYAFHCTAIADGTRTIPVDLPIEFDVVAGPLGRYEAGSIRPR
jgi:cold shock CspA family protein